MVAEDSNYSFNPWMRQPLPGMEPDILGIEVLQAQEMIEAISEQVPPPPTAGYTPRLLGVERTQPGILDVLNVGPVGGLDDAGFQGSLRDTLGHW